MSKCLYCVSLCAEIIWNVCPYSMKSKMEKLEHLSAVGAKEQKLFHGTPDEATVRCICYQNFDPRMYGRHGTVYGKGAYFSTSAKYSHQYTRPCWKTDGRTRRYMFFARVLVGKSTVGNPELQRPPPVDPSRPHGALFDSCVNRSSNPTIFVIFDNDQCYPEFLIEYESYDEERADFSTSSVNVSRSSRVSATVPKSSAAAAVTSVSSYSYSSSASSYPAATYQSIITTSQSSRPVAVSSAAPTPTSPRTLTGSQSTSNIATQSARAQSPASSTAFTAGQSQQSKKGCVVM